MCNTGLDAQFFCFKKISTEQLLAHLVAYVLFFMGGIDLWHQNVGYLKQPLDVVSKCRKLDDPEVVFKPRRDVGL